MLDAVLQKLSLSMDVAVYPVVSSPYKISLVYVSSIVDKNQLLQFVIRPLTEHMPCVTEDPAESFRWCSEYLPVAEKQQASSVQACVEGILAGKCLIAIDGLSTGLLLDTAKFPTRAISEPTAETSIRGPQEGFTEELEINISLIRKRLRDPRLHFEKIIIGHTTKTNISVVYLSSLAADETVNKICSRLRSIQTDSVLESAYLEEWLQETIWSPFPTLLNTERPDVVTAHLLEGKVAILTEGTPTAILAPMTFFQMFVTPEDYYQRSEFATLLRWLRILSFLLAVFTPGLYISIVSFNQELLPTPLLISLAAQREGVPFPAFLEALLMMTIFEVLREAGLRMPRIAGQAISIVGALVVGEAAVAAGLVSTGMVIVVSVTAIANFVAPNYSFGISQRIIQFLFLFLAGFIGLFGLLCGFLLLLIHLVSLDSFGTAYFAPLAPTVLSDWKDTLVRAPKKWMHTMPRIFRPKRKVR
ncbi:spore germination protein [Brevibacillus nitrificans]|uniref:spore germination protein n=1 Tax=Brevibacillus nitrificans TaxID=651560 RepID=UPI002634B1ED|nr:spore germination protein [Brevibacillus nitrificans]MED1793443.1 spore germination protein [Brevibacillus nitrificans]